MFKIILIYAVSLFIGILVSPIALVIISPLAVFIQKNKSLKFPFSLFTGLLEGLLCFSIGVLFFKWFDVKITIWLLLFYITFRLINDLKRFDRSDTDKTLEYGWLIGGMLGLIFGAYLSGLF